MLGNLIISNIKKSCNHIIISFLHENVSFLVPNPIHIMVSRNELFLSFT
jgi:hypothetical protein